MVVFLTIRVLFAKLLRPPLASLAPDLFEAGRIFLENLGLGVFLGKSGARSTSNLHLQKSPYMQKSRPTEQHNL